MKVKDLVLKNNQDAYLTLYINGELSLSADFEYVKALYNNIGDPRLNATVKHYWLDTVKQMPRMVINATTKN